MKIFNYVAYDGSGQIHKGILEGDGSALIRQQLRDKNLTPIEISEVTKPSTLKGKGLTRWQYKRVKIADLALFTRELASLVTANLPLEESLLIVSNQSAKPNMKEIILSVRSRVLEGYSLASALGDYPRVFPEVYRATVEAAEESGHLDLVLMYLADYIEKQERTHQKFFHALIYPSLMAFVSLSIVIFLLVIVVPKITGVFAEAGQSLPILTRLLIDLSNGVQAYGIYILGAIIVSLFIFRRALKNSAFRHKVHRFLLSVPFLGKTIITINETHFSRTLGMLISGDVPILKAMKITTKVITNLPIQDAVNEAALRVREGMAIHRALNKTGYFSPITIHLIANGEASGNLDEMLIKIADNLERNVTQMIETLLTIFEPVLILLMGAIVLFIVLAILLPMFEMSQLMG